jgi:hypothetical protein
MVEALRQALKTYQEFRKAEKAKQRFFHLNPDYDYLRNLLQEMPRNPLRLKFIIRMPNGMTLEICRDDKPVNKRDPFIEEAL